jgi:opacity protein-like surface antigen
VTIKVADSYTQIQAMEESHRMRQTAIMLVGFVMLFAFGAAAQESRSEISVQGTGFFTQDTSGQGVSRTTTDTGGFLVGYRYHINRWLAAEANYGFNRDTQRYFSTGGLSRVQSDVHTATAAAVINLPFRIARLNPYVLGGGGSLVFHPTGNAGGFVTGADTQAKGAFLYGAGVNYTLSKHWSVRAEYRGYVYKDPDFGVRALNTDSWTHTAQPSAGIVFRF